jgi:hypothetical protein
MFDQYLFHTIPTSDHRASPLSNHETSSGDN